MLITSLVGWAGLARVIRGQTLSIKEQDFVQASRVMGGRPLYIVSQNGNTNSEVSNNSGTYS